MTALGINNPNSLYNRSLRAAQLDGLLSAATRSNAMFTITAYAEKIAGRYEAALMLINGGLIAKGEHLAQEYEKQLTLLAEFADEEAGL